MTRIGEIDARTKRLGEIVGVFARYGLVEPLREHVPEPLRRHLVDPDGSVATRSAPERLRLALQELGPTFVKLGQMLTRRCPHWLDHYNRQRPHSSLGDRPPISRVHNVRG